MMKKWMVLVTESISHCYEVEAEDKDGALEAYYRLTSEQLESEDLDGSADWDVPWDISESEG
jgi:hypothetical protein